MPITEGKQRASRIPLDYYKHPDPLVRWKRVLAWGLAANTLRPKVFDDGSTATFIVLGSLLTFSAVLLVSQNQQLLMRPLRPLINRPTQGGLATRLAVAYPIARRFRTGAILIMYGLVVFTLVLITVIGNLISAGTDAEVANASGGFGIRADFNPSSKSLCTRPASSETVLPIGQVNGLVMSGGLPGCFVYTRITPSNS